ncbi:MAG TPA: hypothetical protein VF131_21265 [Blastocatellia bacterium]|nr:hypothetical protein [Blastocatellia bacterium]
MPHNLKKQAADLERRVKQRAETVKKVLREYRETVRASASAAKGASPRTRDKARLQKKRLDVERANAEYMQLQKELDHLRSRMLARK